MTNVEISGKNNFYDFQKFFEFLHFEYTIHKYNILNKKVLG